MVCTYEGCILPGVFLVIKHILGQDWTPAIYNSRFSLLSRVIICTPIEPHYWYWHNTPFQCNQETNRNNSNEVNRYKHIYLRSTLDRSSRCVLNKGQGISPRGSFAIAIHIMSEPITCPLSSFESTSEDMPL